jgi:HPt (histidine-containing phosphotransfer) domain-containing protein
MVIDIEQLERMTMGDAELAAEALGIFRSQAELWTRLMDPTADPTEWADACHAIKGASRSIGAMELGEACAKAEALGRTESVTRAQASVALAEVKDRIGEAIEEVAVIEHGLILSRTFPKKRAG